MTASLLLQHPAFLFILAAVLMPLFQRLRLQKAVLVAVPLIAFLQINACRHFGRMPVSGAAAELQQG